MPKRKGQIKPEESQEPIVLSYNILTEIVRYANPSIVKAQLRYGSDVFEAHGAGPDVTQAEDLAITRVKQLIGQKNV